MSVKQVIVMRRDLGLSRGRLAAQVAHASIKVFFDRLIEVGDGRYEIGPCEDWDWHGAVKPWVTECFTKVVLGAKDKATLLDLQEKAKAAGIPTGLMEESDLGGEPTALALGPAKSEDLDPLVAHLRLA